MKEFNEERSDLRLTIKMKDKNRVIMAFSAAAAFISGALLTASGSASGDGTLFVLGLTFTGIGFVGLVVSFTYPD